MRLQRTGTSLPHLGRTTVGNRRIDQSEAPLPDFREEPNKNEYENMTETSDTSLLQAWVEKKDAEAFTTLVWRHSGMVYGTCRRILRNGTDAEDVAQECFIALAGHRDPIRQSLGGWLHTVATRRSLNRIRAENRRKDRDTSYAAQDRQSTGAVTAGWDEIRGLVDEAIAALPERLRYPVIAHFLEGQTHAAIADTLGVSQPSVTRYIKKGVEEIRSALVSRRVEISASSLTAAMTAKALVVTPEALAANLGKLALAGNEALPAIVTATAAQAIPKGAGYAGGVLLMNAKQVAVAVVLIVVVVAGYGLRVGPDETFGSPVSDSSIANEMDPSEVLGTVPVDSVETNAPDTVDEAVSVENRESIEVTASGGDLSPSPIDADDTIAPNPDEVMPLEVSGVVVNKAGQAITGAVVLLAESNHVSGQGDSLNTLAMRTTTNAQGEFAFTVGALEGTYVVSATAVGYQTEGDQFAFTRDESPADIELVLSEGLLLTGRILTTSLVPVTDATVGAYGFAKQQAAYTTRGGIMMSAHPLGSEVFASTDARGYFVMGFEDFGSTGFTVNSVSRGISTLNGVSIDETLYVELTIADPASLSGRITWFDGSPASGLVVVLDGQHIVHLYQGGPGTGIGDGGSRYEATTDEDGHYVIENIDAGQKYSTRIQLADGTPRVARQPIPELLPGESHMWDHAIQRKIRVFGHVYGELSGRPLGGGQVTNLDDGETTNVSENGSYEMTLLNGSGNYRLLPKYGQEGGYSLNRKYIVELELADGEEREVDLTLSDLLKWEIAVKDSDGLPVEGASVTIRTERSGGLTEQGRSGGDGIIRNLSIRPEVPTWAQISHPNYRSGDSDVVIASLDDDILETTVVLYDTGGVYGVLADADGLALPNAQAQLLVHYDDGRQNYRSISTDENGAFLVEYTMPALSAELSVILYSRSLVGYEAAGAVSNSSVRGQGAFRAGAVVSGGSGGGGFSGGAPIQSIQSYAVEGAPGLLIDLGVVRFDLEADSTATDSTESESSP